MNDLSPPDTAARRRQRSPHEWSFPVEWRNVNGLYGASTPQVDGCSANPAESEDR